MVDQTITVICKYNISHDDPKILDKTWKGKGMTRTNVRVD